MRLIYTCITVMTIEIPAAEMCIFSRPGERAILTRTVTEVLKEPVRL